jgi:hypothetical protein
MDERIKTVVFNEEEHTYWYQGRELHGVTGAIGKLMGKKFPDTDNVKIATMYGSDVHKEVENYFNKHEYKFNDSELSTKGAQWIIDELRRFTVLAEEGEDKLDMIECEVMVSDFIGTASKVDIVLRTKQNKVWLFDIKTTTTFDRPYCSLQLSVYKRLYEQNYGGTVMGMFVLGTKAKRAFRIIEQPFTKVDKILDMNKPKEV